MDNKKTNEPFWGLIVLVGGILICIICTVMCSSDERDKLSQKSEEVEYVYYNVPFYTTIYEIVYTDTVFRYTVVHHSPSSLTSHRGSNFLYSATHSGSWADKRPEYWLDSWNKDELDVETTAPIRIISETVEYKKMRYKKK